VKISTKKKIKRVGFRATLDETSLSLLGEIGKKWQLKLSPTAAKLAESFRGKQVKNSRLAKFIANEWPDLEPKYIGNNGGVLYSWFPETRAELKRLAFEANLNGNESKMLRVLIYYTAIQNDIEV
jgi:hypothetical protein